VDIVGLLALAALLGLLPGWIASRKGRSFFEWWIFGALFFIIALPAALIVGDRRRRCPYCAEPIRDEAVVCPHCQRDLLDTQVGLSR
jgi:hypothetical protein